MKRSGGRGPRTLGVLGLTFAVVVACSGDDGDSSGEVIRYFGGKTGGGTGGSGGGDSGATCKGVECPPPPSAAAGLAESCCQTNEACGFKIPSIGQGCLPPADSDASNTDPDCPSVTWQGKTLPGCCLPDGKTCGAVESLVGTGCLDATLFGVKATVDCGGNPVKPFPPPTHYWPCDTATITGTTLKPVLPATGGINGTLVGGVTTAAGKVGQALSLDGVSGFVDFGDVLDNHIAGVGKAFTVAMWVNLAGPFAGNGDNGAGALWNKSSGACPGVTFEREVGLAIRDNGNPYAAYATQGNADGQFGIKGTTQLSASKWHHVVFTYDQTVTTSFADRMAMYVDGVLVVESPYEHPVGTPFSTSHAVLDTASHLAVGAIRSSTQTCNFPFLKGLIDEHAFWVQVLTPSEIGALYAWGNSGKAIAP